MTTPFTAESALAYWHEPDGIPPRGTVVVLAGRGETSTVYERFGRRIASDAYRVVAVPDAPDTVVDGAIASILGAPDTVGPIVLVGSDTGTAAVRRLARRHRDQVAAVVLAGLPPSTPTGRSPEDDVVARTSCPNHRRVLAAHSTRGLFAQPLVAGIAPGEETLPVPVLALHGGADVLSPVTTAADDYARLGATEVFVVAEGTHDILNDVTHRTVAATVVLFLERVKAGHDLLERRSVAR